MSPRLKPGQIIVVSGWFKSIRPGQVYIFLQDGKEKIKRVERVRKHKVFFIGDNLRYSTDSRHFGWVEKGAVLAKVVWPLVHNH
ncbi:S26 family signal peptidase [Patescibacteria group bacterium]|jgi:phage repressor protein C with HTH and peptisase S24 domain|nr:S26 family signal peptidase [Patescibacteria group bacterium]